MQFFALAAAAAAVLAATTSAVSVITRQNEYVPPENLFAFPGQTQVEVATRFATNCLALGDGPVVNMQVQMKFHQKLYPEAPLVAQLSCIQARNRAAAMRYTNRVGKISGLEKVYKSDGKCNEISSSLCSKADYDTTITEGNFSEDGF